MIPSEPPGARVLYILKCDLFLQFCSCVRRPTHIHTHTHTRARPSRSWYLKELRVKDFLGLGISKNGAGWCGGGYWRDISE